MTQWTGCYSFMLPSPSYGGRIFFLAIRHLGIVLSEGERGHRYNHGFECLLEGKGVNEFVTS